MLYETGGGDYLEIEIPLCVGDILSNESDSHSDITAYRAQSRVPELRKNERTDVRASIV